MQEINHSRIFLLLKGVSGAGKSSYAEYMEYLFSTDYNKDCIICTADEYFEQDGEYKFDPTKLGAAHNYCFNKFLDGIKNKIELVIVANTSTRESECSKYLDAARAHGYTIFSLVVENVNGTKSVHNVPEETLAKQKQRLLSSIKL